VNPPVLVATVGSVRDTSASFYGSSDSEISDCRFDYGIDAFDSSVSPAACNVDADSNAVATSLQPGTTYRVRFVSTNIVGTATSDDVTFTTTATPSVAAESPTVTSTTATLRASVNPNGPEIFHAIRRRTGSRYVDGTGPVLTPTKARTLMGTALQMLWSDRRRGRIRATPPTTSAS